MKAAAFLDRDGVLNVDTGYPVRPADIIWQRGAAQAVRLLNEAGFRVVVVTNQSGIARGLFTMDDVIALHVWMAEALSLRGARIDRWYICPFHAEASIPIYRHANHPDRKPNPGMLLRAAAENDIDLERSFLIGDKFSDMEAARAANIPGYLFAGADLEIFTREVLSMEHDKAHQCVDSAERQPPASAKDR